MKEGMLREAGAGATLLIENSVRHGLFLFPLVDPFEEYLRGIGSASCRGVRVGAPAMTTRGCTEQDFKTIGGPAAQCLSVGLLMQTRGHWKVVASK